MQTPLVFDSFINRETMINCKVEVSRIMIFLVYFFFFFFQYHEVKNIGDNSLRNWREDEQKVWYLATAKCLSSEKYSILTGSTYILIRELQLFEPCRAHNYICLRTNYYLIYSPFIPFLHHFNFHISLSLPLFHCA